MEVMGVLKKIWQRYRMFRRILRYGWKYLYDDEEKKRVKNRECTLRNRKKYGHNFIAKGKHQKSILFKKKGNICFWCGEKMKFKDATRDHIIPRSKGGSNSISNLRLIHEKCRVDKDWAEAKGIYHE